MSSFRHDFLAFAHAQGALSFGEFQTKSGRLSPYFFNTGRFQTGRALAILGGYYAHAIRASGVAFDHLYGPAYKGIPLVSTVAIALTQLEPEPRDLPYSFNRKEAKDHGEGGTIVGAPLKGRVLIVDDVITAGTSVRESVEIIRAANATPAGVVITMDRMERGSGQISAVQEVQANFGIPVVAIATLNDVLDYVSNVEESLQFKPAIIAYRERFGV